MMDSETRDPEEAVEVSDEAKREFLAKVVAVVGALAAAGLAAGVVSAGVVVEDKPPALDRPAVAVGPLVSLARAPLMYQKLQNGHAFELTSTELTSVLAREGLVSHDWIGKQSQMRLALLFSH
jgi:hypothetical protein